MSSTDGTKSHSGTLSRTQTRGKRGSQKAVTSKDLSSIVKKRPRKKKKFTITSPSQPKKTNESQRLPIIVGKTFFKIEEIDLEKLMV